MVLIVLAIHHQWVLSLMARPLRLNKMGSEAALKFLEACHMSGEALPAEEIMSRVRGAVASAFQVK